MAVSFTIPGQERKLPLASNKALYTNVFFHGDNLDDTLGAAFSVTSANDNFARQNYLIRKPRVVRVLYTTEEPAAFTDHYDGLFQSLATALPSICVCWGKYSGPFGSLNQRWLNDATPDFAGLHPASDLVVGKVFTYVFVDSNFAYGSDVSLPFGDYGSPLSSLGQNYANDYAAFTAKHERFEKFGGHIYQASGGGSDIAEIISRAVSGASPLDQFGPGLDQFGWSITRTDWHTSYVSLATIQTEVEDFFGIS